MSVNLITLLKKSHLLKKIFGNFGREKTHFIDLVMGCSDSEDVISLNLLKLPYTHSGVEASAIAMNKIHFKRIITNATENTTDPIFFP